MLRTVSNLIAIFLLITGCGTNVESIDYYSGGEPMNLIVEKVGDAMRFELSLTNEGDEPMQLQFPSGQQFEIFVKDEKNKVVYRYSEGKMFTMAIVMKELKPKETLIWEDEWKEAPPGSYTVIGELQIFAINDESVNRERFKVEKTITIEK